MALYRILSFDGGGIRGLLSTVLVRRLVDESTVSGLLGESQYCRVQPIFEEDYRMDSVGRIPEIMAFADDKVDLGKAVEWVNRNWSREPWMRILGQNLPKRRFS